jgi:hypothetical protein
MLFRINIPTHFCLVSNTAIGTIRQNCTEKQYHPAEVAHILDSALSGLQPCSSQNIPIFREIEMCMGIIKNQMLALIPTPSG